MSTLPGCVPDWLQKLARAAAEWVERCLTRFEPELWNDANGIQYHNNCYNYGCNTRTDTFAQPGRASGNLYDALNCDEVQSGAVSDGLRRTAATDVGARIAAILSFS